MSRLPEENLFYFFSSYFRLNILQYPYIPICSFSRVVKWRTSNLRVLDSNPDRGAHSPPFFLFPLIFVEPPTYPHPDLNPDWTPTTSTPTFFSFIISSIRSSHPPDPHPIAPSTFQFYNSFNSWITTTRPHPRPDRPPYSETDFHKG